MKKGGEKECFREVSSLKQFIEKNEEQFKRLTEEEIKILTLLAKETPPLVICKELSLSPDDLIEKELRIRKKLSLGLETEYIKYALGFGLISF